MVEGCGAGCWGWFDGDGLEVVVIVRVVVELFVFFVVVFEEVVVFVVKLVIVLKDLFAVFFGFAELFLALFLVEGEGRERGVEGIRLQEAGELEFFDACLDQLSNHVPSSLRVHDPLRPWAFVDPRVVSACCRVFRSGCPMPELRVCDAGVVCVPGWILVRAWGRFAAGGVAAGPVPGRAWAGCPEKARLELGVHYSPAVGCQQGAGAIVDGFFVRGGGVADG